MIVINLQQIGFVPHRFCEPAELTVVLQIAEEIMADTEPDQLDQILTEWETALIWRSLEATRWMMNGIIVPCC